MTAVAAVEAPAQRTYGTVRYVPGLFEGGRDGWELRVEPHITMRLKRMFPRVYQGRAAALYLSDTAEVARDLEMVLTRWALLIDPASEAHLNRRAEQHRAAEDSVTAILGGYQPPLGADWASMAVPLYGYQEAPAQMVWTTGRLLLGDDVGLGKTAEAIAVLRNPDALPALVVTLTALPRQWQREINRFLPHLRVHLATSMTPYDPTTRRGGGPWDVLVMNYAKVRGWGDWLPGMIRTVIFDEAHELRNPDAEKTLAAARIADQALYRIGLTATPIYNYGNEIHAVVGILDRDALGERTEFQREWCTGGSDSRGAMVEDPAALGQYLRQEGIMLRRTREDVGAELPEVMHVEQAVETSPAVIEELSRASVLDIARIVMSSTDRDERFHAGGQLDIKMRQITGIAKAPYVAAFVKLLLQSEERVVLVGWHREVYRIWLEKLAEFNPLLYTGSESGKVKDENVQRFIRGGDDAPRVLMMSLRSAAGLDGLQAVCRVIVFGELDWSPAQHHQAVGRLHRPGQTNPVVAYFMLSDKGSDPPMAAVLDVKRQQSDPILDPTGAVVRPSVDPGQRSRLLAEQVLAEQITAEHTAEIAATHATLFG